MCALVETKLNPIYLFLLLERILIHIPARRPTVDDMLSSQFVTHPKLSNDLMQHEINLRSKPVKRPGFWVRSKSRRMRKQYSLRERYMELTNKPPINMSTKRTDGFFVDNFLQPIELNDDIPLDVIKEQSKSNTPKRSFLCGTIKKKVGPMESTEKEKQLTNGSLANHKSQWNSVLAPECPLFKNYDAENGRYIMFPTPTDDLSSVQPLEAEARQILEELGITSAMLQAASQNAPRSDVIGAYRIVISRLQKQSWLTRKHVEMALQEIPTKIEKKIERSCCIL